jgi:hypothetical protein
MPPYQTFGTAFRLFAPGLADGEDRAGDDRPTSGRLGDAAAGMG